MSSLPSTEHPALSGFDISGYNGLNNKNLFENDFALQRMIKVHTSGLSEDHQSAIWMHLVGYGELVGGRLSQLTEACHKEGKYGELQKYDRTGNRIDEIIYSPEQRESRKISFDYGVVNLDFHTEWKYDFLHIHRYGLTYLMNLNGEGGVACPLAMTDGLIFALKNIATPEIRERFLPLLTSKNSHSHFMGGQYVTERVGGSNVAANRTTAQKNDDGTWTLNGEKWFCSNPGDLWVTTAKIEGTNTIGMFLVSRWKRDGKLNGHHILRKKDIIGSRGKATVEIIYKDVEAEELGRPSHGLVNLIQYIIQTSRIHVGMGACGNSRRALLEALEYSRTRTAYEKKIEEFPILGSNLCDLVIEQTMLIFSNFESVVLWEKKSPLAELFTPLLKYKSSSLATDISHESILVLGGNGILGDFSPLPRLLNDSIINESWEGTHLIITDHVLRAIQKKKIYEKFKEWTNSILSEVEKSKNLQRFTSFQKNSLAILDEILTQKTRSFREYNRVLIADLIYTIFSRSLLLREAHRDNLDSSIANSIYSDMLVFLDEYSRREGFGKATAKTQSKSIFQEEPDSHLIHKILQFGRGERDQI